LQSQDSRKEFSGKSAFWERSLAAVHLIRASTQITDWSEAMGADAKRVSRRGFLLAMGAGGAATAAAMMVKNGASSPPAGKGRRASRGYQATEHVSNYYRTTKV
jgi:hypothetical protein